METAKLHLLFGISVYLHFYLSLYNVIESELPYFWKLGGLVAGAVIIVLSWRLLDKRRQKQWRQ